MVRGANHWFGALDPQVQSLGSKLHSLGSQGQVFGFAARSAVSRGHKIWFLESQGPILGFHKYDPRCPKIRSLVSTGPVLGVLISGP